MGSLDGKTVLLTGASSGIGAATVHALGEAGAHVVAHYHNDRAGVLNATRRIPDERKLLVQADFSDAGSARDLWHRAVSWSGHIDVLVNNAGVMLESNIDDADDKWERAWSTTYAVNVLTPMNLARCAVEHFRAQGGGVLITMSSVAGLRGSAQMRFLAYAASKAAVRASTQTIARTQADKGVLAYVIAPGTVQTRMTELAAQGQEGEAATSAALPMGAQIPPGEVSELVVFLAGGRQRHLSGATFDINGAVYIR